MAKTSIKDIRRKELSQAAFEVLMQYGIRGATLDRVAKLSGISRGVVLHYFKDKDALFQGVQRKTNSLLREGVVELLSHAETPEERLYAIVVGNFAPTVFVQEICHAWINLCADVPHNEQSQRIQTVVHARMRSNLYSALRKIVSPEDIETTAMQITTMIDGIWVRASLQKEPMSSQEGIDQVDWTIHHLLTPNSKGKERLQQARIKMDTLANIILTSRTFRQRAAE